MILAVSSIFVLLTLSACHTPIQKQYKLIEVDLEKTEYWERPDGTRFIRFELPSGKIRIMEAN